MTEVAVGGLESAAEPALLVLAATGVTALVRRARGLPPDPEAGPARSVARGA
jgi:hypothetical protein